MNEESKDGKVDIIPMEELLPKVEKPVQPNNSNTNQPVNSSLNNQEYVNNIQPTNNNQNNIQQNNNVNQINNQNSSIVEIEKMKSDNVLQKGNKENTWQKMAGEQNQNVGNNSSIMNEKPSSKAANFLGIVIALAIVGVGAYFLIFNTNKRKLVCTRKTSEYIEDEISVSFKDSKIIGFSMQSVYDLSSLTDDVKETAKKEDICASYKSSYEELYTFKNCHSKISGDKIIISLDMDIKNNNNEEVNVLDIRDNLEQAKYTCVEK